ncbi:MAG: glycosyltransferase family 2 protein [Bacteroidetes bacterium]|nr:glycosyltransferase family 2 protein [Bacteroidota bacterium]
MKLSVIIVNYRSATYIGNCIRSAMQFDSGKGFEWIVVDNASGDNSKELICQEFPFVQWIDMGYNAGFARANNEGMRHASGSIYLLLNPDTLILDNAIDRCVQKLENSTAIGCGVQLLYEDHSIQISGSYFMKGGINHLLPIPYWGSVLKGLAKILHTKKPGVEQVADEVYVDWISGAFLMVKKEAVVKSGMMDEDFFLYAEEVEWCSRLKQLGNLVLYGDIKIIHLLGEAIKDSTGTDDKTYANLFDKKGLQLIVSNHVRIRKQYGIAWFLFQLLNYSFGVLVFFVGSFFNNLLHFNNPLKDWTKIVGLAKNVVIVWGLSFTIIRNQPHFYKML